MPREQIINGQATFSKAGSLTAAGKRFYQDQLKSVLEPDHVGQFVAIEPKSGNYFLGETAASALLTARSAMPEHLFYLTRVGYPAAASLGGYGFRNRVD